LGEFDISKSYLLFRPVPIPKIHVLNQQIVPFTLNISRIGYCYALVLTLQVSGEIRQDEEFRILACGSHHTCCGSHHLLPPELNRARF